MVLLGLILTWFLITLWRRPDRFAIGVFLAAIGFLVTLNLLNPDAFVARQNLDRYGQSGKLDAVYLTSLSDDAVPQLVRALTLTEGDDTEQLQPSCSNLSGRMERVIPNCYVVPSVIIAEEIDGRYEQMNTDTSWQSWQSFNIARWLAFASLQVVAHE